MNCAEKKNSSLAGFDFEAEGITITGRKYPIVLMEWIDGPTLDSFVEQVLGNKNALQQLADGWLHTRWTITALTSEKRWLFLTQSVADH